MILRKLSFSIKYLLIFLFISLCYTEAISQGFNTITNLDPLPIDAGVGTDNMSQSKTFEYNGNFWAILANSTGTHLWRLNGETWTNVLRLTTRKGRADIKVAGNLLHVFVFQSTTSQLISLEYESATNTYKPWSQRSSLVDFSFNKEISTASIDIDGTGRMWLAYVRNSQAVIQTSSSPYISWSSPIIMDQVRSDDKATVIAMPGKIGVFWSNQVTKKFGFKTHVDGATITSWSADETPASQSALNIGAGMADDHMNIKAASDGTLYCAVKTGYNNSSHPLIALLVRRPSGNWDNLYPVMNRGTTPIAILNEAADKIKVIYVSQTYGGDILYKESSTSNISFGNEQILMKGGSYRDPSASKGAYNNSIVIIANDMPNARAVGVLATDGEISPTPPGTLILSSPAHASSNVALSPTLSWNSTQGATSYNLEVSTDSNFSSILTDLKGMTSTSVNIMGLNNATEYFWRVRGSNGTADGPWSSIWHFTTLSSSRGEELVGHWKMDEGSGNTLVDHSGYNNNAILKNPGGISWSAGAVGLGLNLPGTTDRFGEAGDHPSLNITDQITVAVWIKPSILKTKTILSKVSPNGYQLNTTHKGNLEFWINPDSHGNTYKVISSGTYPFNGSTWIHVAATFDGQTAKIYLNGVEDNSVTFSSPVKIGTNSSKLTIGAYESSLRFFGSMDDVRLYRSALNGTEISSLFSNTTGQNVTSRMIMVGDILYDTIDAQEKNSIVEIVASDSFPSWLIYDKAQGLLTGIPTEKDLGTITLRITNLAQGGVKKHEKYIELRVEKQPDPWRQIQSKEDTPNLTLHPNPVSDRLFIHSEELDQQEITLSIYDINGKLQLKLNTLINSPVTEITQINQVLGTGVYMMVIEGYRFRKTFKILKK